MNNILKWSVIWGLFLALLTPLIISSSMLFPFISGKAIYFKVVVEVVFALYFILAIRDPEYRPKRSWLSMATLVFVLVVLIADIFGINPHKSFWSNFERMEGFFLILHLWMFFVVASSMLVKKYWNYFLTTSVCISLIPAWYALCQLAGKIDIRQGSDRVDSTLGNAIYLAVYMLLNIGFALYLYVNRKKEDTAHKKNASVWYAVTLVIGGLCSLVLFPYLAKYLPISATSNFAIVLGIAFWIALAGALVYLIGLGISAVSKTKRYTHFLYLVTVVCLQFFVIFKTATRGTMIGITVGLLVSLVLYAIKAKEDRVGRTVAAVLLALIVLGGVGFFSLRNTDFVKSNQSLSRFSTISIENARTKYIWPIAFKGISERPMLGYGQEGFNYVFNKHYNPKMWTEEQWFDRAHSVYLDWFIAAGVLGFGLYVSLYIFALVYVWKGDFSIKEKVVLVGLLVAYAINNAFVFDNISSYVLFFALLAFIHSHKAKEHIKEIKINVDVRDLIVVPIGVLAVAVLMYYTSINQIRVGSLVIDGIRQHEQGVSANLEKYKKAMTFKGTGGQEVREQATQTAESIIRSDAPAQIKQEFFNLSQEAIREQIAYAPLDARAYIMGGAYYNRLGQFDLALPLLTKAHELTPAKQVPLFEIATSQLNKGQHEAAVASVKTALDLDPNYPEAKRYYVFVLLYTNKIEQLKAYLQANTLTDINEMLINEFIEKRQHALLGQVLTSMLENDPKNTVLQSYLANLRAGKHPIQK